MDAVELARQAAAELHAKAVAAGADPWKPYALVQAIAKGLGLDVEPVQPGSPVLNGGRAVFDPHSRAIVHEHTGDEFHHALLVGHEIGHATLGDDRVPDTVLEVDPARSAEAAPVGEERVVDYSRRQRREVQMDLFGRELIMPRPWVRDLHMAGLGAAPLAERLGAPFDAVAQQLLDALLLPAVAPAAAKPKAEKPLNAAQHAAAEHRGTAYLLEAGPGTGKTQTLVGRILSLLAEPDADPRGILVLTFSNKAAGELSERIAAVQPGAAAAMTISTFHAFGLDLVRRFHRDLGFDHEPRMMDRTEAVEFLEHQFPRLGLTHYRNLWDPSGEIQDILSAISRAKDEVVDHDGYLRLAQAMARNAGSDDERAAAAKCDEVARTYAAYEALKAREVAVDFGDLVALPVLLLERHPAVQAELKARYQHILVDEYQDVNRSSVRLLQLMTDHGRNLWAVGDARQSIYRFRGASSFNMARFAARDFRDAKTGRLEINYRSTQEIVDAYSAFGATMEAGQGPADLDAERGPSGQLPEHRIVLTGADEPAGLAATIAQLRDAGVAYRDQAVLCTGNERLARLGRALEQRGVPVLYLGSLFERPEIKDLISWLTLLVDGRAMGLARWRAPEPLNLTLADAAAMIDHLREADAAAGVWRQPAYRIPGLSDAGARTLGQVAQVLDGFTADARPWDVLARLLLDRTRWAAALADASDVAVRAQGLAIWQFMNFLRVQPRAQGLPIQVLMDRIRRLVELADERDLRQLPLAASGIDAVRLMTIHGSKGLEFPAVHVMGLNAGALPRTAADPRCPPPDGLIEGGEGSGLDLVRAGRVEEQECVFYVALSRARDRLFVYSAAEKSNGHRYPESPYLGRLGAGVTTLRMPAEPRLPDPEAAPLPVRFEGPLSLTEVQLSQYERCPRRFFYTHVLRIGGKRTASPFVDMHAVVQGLITTLAEQSPDALDDALVDRMFDAAWTSNRVAEHGYADDYRAIARRLIGYFTESRRGLVREPPTALRLSVPGGQVVVTPDEVLVDSHGARAVRRIRTGHKRSKEDKTVTATAFHLAASEAFPGCRVELVFLGDEAPLPLDIAAKAAAKHRDAMGGLMQGIAAGEFAPEPSSFVCPRCPAFFICGPLPHGAAVKKFAPALPVGVSASD